QLYGDLRLAYHQLRESTRRARLAAQGQDRVLRVGTLPSNAHELRPFWDAFRARHPHWGLRVRYNGFVRPFAPLRDGEIDALICWLPVREPDVSVGPVVFTEPRVLLAAPGHHLATRSSVSIESLADFGVLRPAEALPEYWEDVFNPFHTPGGRPVPRGPAVRQMDDILMLVGTGEAVQPMGAHAARYHARPDVLFLPLHDAPRLRWGLVWRSDAESEQVRALAQVIRDLGTAHL
ncbi:LysR substrate-binding domain-containing protein, partial [Nonomuraea sp. NPDC050783]|uniref:LysR substrate-binding domain-containing protein n=1 Tax=Nonomuraea sp. NPDC050783 TaxID=3154634 RepID=UPI0034657AD2